MIKRSEMAAHFSMNEAIDSMSSAFASLSSGDSYVPKRYIVNTKDESLTFLLKPAFIKGHDRSSVKILTQKNSNSIPGIPTILGIVLLIDNVTGEILSIMDGEFITALRTGAASGLATKYLSREDSSKAAIFGCGRQGRTQLEAIKTVRKLEKIWIFDKSPEQAEAFIEEMDDKTKKNMEVAPDLSVLKDVDIICAATNSESPLFYKKHLKKGTHINAIGSFKPEMQELDPEIINLSRVYFDDKEACLNESGDFVKPFRDSRNFNENIMGEIGEYVLNRIEGRISSKDITIFKSVGTAIQDFVVANRIYNKSMAEKFGTEIRLYE
ncbi:MAG: ornithine cyclodeaminase [Candidatus Neomarinimicrobiota bacterium]